MLAHTFRTLANSLFWDSHSAMIAPYWGQIVHQLLYCFHLILTPDFELHGLVHLAAAHVGLPDHIALYYDHRVPLIIIGHMDVVPPNLLEDTGSSGNIALQQDCTNNEQQLLRILNILDILC